MENKEGNLMVWHIPQVPGKPFYVPVNSPNEAVKVLGILSYYDLFQLKHNIKPDYSNTSGLEVFEGGEWIEWYNEDGEGIDDYSDGSMDDYLSELNIGEWKAGK